MYLTFRPTALLDTPAIIGIAAGGAGGVLLLTVVCLLMVCVYCCARRGHEGGECLCVLCVMGRGEEWGRASFCCVLNWCQVDCFLSSQLWHLKVASKCNNIAGCMMSTWHDRKDASKDAFLMSLWLLCVPWCLGLKIACPNKQCHILWCILHRDGGQDFTDARGNVDRDSDEEIGQVEAYDPDYGSLPALRPAQPPQYRPTPSYPHGGTGCMTRQFHVMPSAPSFPSLPLSLLPLLSLHSFLFSLSLLLSLSSPPSLPSPFPSPPLSSLPLSCLSLLPPFSLPPPSLLPPSFLLLLPFSQFICQTTWRWRRSLLQILTLPISMSLSPLHMGNKYVVCVEGQWVSN